MLDISWSSMGPRRRLRLLTVVMTLWALVVTQAALASYACPGAAKAALVTTMTEAGMPCAESISMAMDDQNAALCHAHCQSAQKTPDNVQPPSLAAAAELGAILTVALPAEPTGAGTVVRSSRLRTPASTPPSLAYCCLRI